MACPRLWGKVEMDAGEHRALTPRERRRLRRLILLLLAAGLLFLFLAPGRGILALLHARGRVQALEREQQALIKRNRELAAEIKRLQIDDAYLEELARKKYGLLRENEMVYEFGSKKTGNKNRKSD